MPNRFKQCSGNIFEDLGFENPQEELVKAKLAAEFVLLIRKKGWIQSIAAKRLGISQPKVSLLMRGQLKNFSVEKLMNLLNKLSYDIEIKVRRRASGRGLGHIRVYSF